MAEKNSALDLWDDTGKTSGVKIRIEYNNNCFSLMIQNWRTDENIKNGSIRVKKRLWLFDELNTRRLMDYFDVKTGKKLLEVLDSLYISHVTTIDRGLEDVCKSFNIVYEYKDE